ncbi:hypothetical protein ACYJGC_004371 [Klebsiella pneumoniae]|uniref:hypothetical protein n=1 Tax=Klebsiella pneumoniae TaxID=573 RepID=UPI001CBBDE39|nr:hypothetical protein [Klebsiella pneumoniae]EKX7637474.1 hypothetical protein [Klebsiella pneumoniae]ELA1308027.1 hypothetical protein [Klebsiella pneumoniae]MBZ1696870.1 hypothetical protein [Klebsiella pneumoniae]HDZ2531246.1 hypothetical protein [Klebsiella pneumoniae]HDZ2539718.1 hypothetical protein [Klebsiella pneumoniae]
MTDIYYPSEYLPLPLQDGYGLTPVSPLQITKQVSGRNRKRRKYLSTPSQAKVKWIFQTDEQAQLFEAWYRDALCDGAAWFMMPLQTPIGLKFYKSQFTDIYDGPTLIAPRYWQFSAELDLWERPLVPSDWGNYPELLMGSSIIDIAINKDWPKS